MKRPFASRTPRRDQLQKVQAPQVVQVPSQMSRFGEGRMLIPTSLLVNELVRPIPKGKLITGSELRRKLTADFATNTTCPLTTGIFLRIAVEAAEEDRAPRLSICAQKDSPSCAAVKSHRW